MNPKRFLVSALLGGLYLVISGAVLLHSSTVSQDILKGIASVIAGLFLTVFGVFGLKGRPPRGDINT